MYKLLGYLRLKPELVSKKKILCAAVDKGGRRF